MTANPSRRRFLLATAAAAGATWFDVPRILAASGARSAALKMYGGFPMGIQSYSLRGYDAATAVRKTGEMGLHYIEFFASHYPPTTDGAKIAQMNAMLDKADLSISSHGVQGFSKNHAANEAFFQFAKKAGLRNISADPTPDAFDSLDKLVAKYDIRIAIHNHGPGARYDKAADVLKAIEGHDKRIGFCADLGHYIRSSEDPVKVIHQAKGRLYGIHLKDFAEQKKNTQGVILGKGHLDVAGVFAALKAVKFPADGALSLEYEEHPKNPDAEIKECLAVAAAAAQKVAAG